MNHQCGNWFLKEPFPIKVPGGTSIRLYTTEECSSASFGMKNKPLGYIKLVQDELRLAWKVDESRQQQGAVTTNCRQVGRYPAASKQNIQGVTDSLFDAYVVYL